MLRHYIGFVACCVSALASRVKVGSFESDGAQSCADSWAPDWASSASASCSEWFINTEWGALKNGQTIEQACGTEFAIANCAATCGCQEIPPVPWEFIFCRHGQSANNLLMHGNMSAAIRKFGRHSFSLDSPLTERGKNQARATRAYMKSKFKSDDIRLPMLRLMTSSLQRAKETAQIISRSDPTSELQNPNGERVEVDQRVNELTPEEHVMSGGMETRIKDFVQAMLRRPAEERPQAVVGHSLWYKQLTKMDSKISNAACRQVTISPSITNDGRGFRASEYSLFDPN